MMSVMRTQPLPAGIAGFPDASASIDLNTYRAVPWDNDVPFFLADFSEKNNQVCPRTLLKKVLADANNEGLDPIFSQEYEWFNFEDTSKELHDRNFSNLNPITRGMFGYSLIRASERSEFFNDLFDLMEKFNIKLEGLHTETGPGVYEAAIMYAPILEAADRSVLFKAAVKEIGHRHKIMPTFMAKWDETLPGTSGHIHQSLWRDGQNIFFDSNDSNKMSETMKHYIAGLLHCLRMFFLSTLQQLTVTNDWLKELGRQQQSLGELIIEQWPLEHFQEVTNQLELK